MSSEIVKNEKKVKNQNNEKNMKGKDSERN